MTSSKVLALHLLYHFCPQLVSAFYNIGRSRSLKLLTHCLFTLKDKFLVTRLLEEKKNLATELHDEKKIKDFF